MKESYQNALYDLNFHVCPETEVFLDNAMHLRTELLSLEGYQKS